MSAKFQDVMDNDRIVEPVRQEGRSLICKIYWRDRDGNLRFGGQAPIPASLFDEGPRNRFIGFIPYEA